MSVGVKTKEKTTIKVKKPNMYKVIMYNDDFTTMEFVVEVLREIFNKELEEAERIMLDVHKKGKGIAGIYTYDIAITKVSTAVSWAEEQDFPFRMTVEEA